MSVIHCPSCGAQNQPDAHTCTFCGQPLRGGAPQSAPPPIVPSPPVRADAPPAPAPTDPSAGYQTVTAITRATGCGGAIFALIFITFPLIMGVVLFRSLVIGELDRRSDEQQLAASSALATGQIVSTRVRDNDDNADTYFVRYRFRDAEEVGVYEREAQVSRDVYQASKSGAPIQVRYLPRNPDVSRITGERAAYSLLRIGLTALAGLGFLAIFMLLGLGLGWQARKEQQRYQRWRAAGVTESARVVQRWERQEKDSDGDKVTRYYLGFELPVRAPDGSSMLRRFAQSVSKQRYAAHGPDAVLPVRYIPAEPEALAIDEDQLKRR